MSAFAAISSSWALLLGIGLMMLGNGLQGTLLGLRASLEGFPTTTVGLVMTGYYVGFLAGSTIVPRLLGNVGHIRVFAALASIASAAVLLHSVFLQPWVWALMRLATGFAYAGMYIVAESWLNDRATNETRGKLLSVYMLITIGGMGVGQLLLNVADPASFELFVLTSVLVSLALVPISLTVSPAPAFQAPETVGVRIVYAASPLGLVACMLIGSALGAMFTMGAVYARSIGLPVVQVSYFMATVLLGALVMQWPIGHLSDRFDRRRVIATVAVLAAGAAIAAALLGERSHAALLVTAFLIGGLSMPLYSLSIAHTNDHLQPRQMVAASGTLVLANGVGSIAGPSVASFAMSAIGPAGFFWFQALALGAIATYAIWRMTRRASVPLSEQRHYDPIPPRATAIAAGIASSAMRDARDRDFARMSSRRT